MRKTILFLTLLLLAGCGKKEPSETKMPPSRADNDSPIIISDTPTLPGTKDRTNGTMVEHVAPSGNPEHFHTNPSTGRFFVHDKEKPASGGGKDTYRPACLVVPAHTPPIIPVPATATSMQIFFADAGNNEVLNLTWSDALSGAYVAKDVPMNSGGFSYISPTDKTKIVKPMQVDHFTWTFDQQPQHPPITASPGTLLEVRYCPKGQCTDVGGKDLCK
jgi:hypothetical protein